MISHYIPKFKIENERQFRKIQKVYFKPRMNYKVCYFMASLRL